jgi:cytochrome P450 RapN
MSDTTLGAPAYPFGMAERLDLHPEYARLRKEEPLARVTMPFGGEALMITRHADVRMVLSDPRFSRAAAVGIDAPRLTPQQEDGSLILSMDAPDHTRLRKLVSRAFTARRIAGMREDIQRMVDGLLDAMVAGRPTADFAEAVAWPLPITAICELLGVPFEDRARFVAWTDQLMALSTDQLDTVMAAGKQLDDYLAGLIEQRRRTPTDDLLGVLVSARDDDDRLTERELVTFGTTLLIGGYETTASQIGSFVYVLLSQRDHWARLVADPDLVPAAVEELLRYTPLGTTSGGFPRIATEDVDLPSGLVRAGQAVMTQVAVANRDERVFDNPEDLDFGRADNPHLSFGHGPHHCLGAQLARMELQLTIGTLVRRFPELRLTVPADEVVWRTNRMIRGVQRLPVTW